MTAALHRWAPRAVAFVLLGSLVPPALGLARLLQPVPVAADTTRDPPAPSAAAAAQSSDLGLILEAAPFGRPALVPTGGTDGASGLVLVGVTVATGTGASRAMIAGGSRGAAAMYSVGDAVLDGITLTGVQPEGVTLDAGGEVLHLGFPEAAGRAAAAETAPAGGPIDFSGTATPSPGAQP